MRACMRACVLVCVCACVRACVLACARARACVCSNTWHYDSSLVTSCIVVCMWQ